MRLAQVEDDALPSPLFRRLVRAVRALGAERLRETYQTTFWLDLSAPPANLVEEAVIALRPRLPPTPRATGVEWWLSRMRTTDVRIDFHRDHDIALAARTGRVVTPIRTAVLFLNRTRGGLLVITREPPDERNPSCAPSRTKDWELVEPRPNRLATFAGGLTHGVLDARNRVPDRKLSGRPALRLAVVANFWARRPEGVPAWRETGVYRRLGSSPSSGSRSRPWGS